MITFTHWSDLFGDNISRMRESDTGRIVLTMNGEFNEDALHALFLDGIRPKEAAKVLHVLNKRGFKVIR